MNCLECRRALATEPRRRTPELDAHLRGCSACARRAGEHARFEQQLCHALRLAAPEHLGDRIRLEANLRRRRPWRRRCAAAAVLAIAVTLTLGGLEYRTSQNLASAIAARTPAVDAPARALTDPVLVRRAAAFGRFLHDAGLGRITSAGQAMVDGQRAASLRVVNDNGYAQVYLLPKARLALAHDFEVHGTPGKLIPTDHGIIAVLCPDRQMLARVARSLTGAPPAPG